MSERIGEAPPLEEPSGPETAPEAGAPAEPAPAPAPGDDVVTEPVPGPEAAAPRKRRAWPRWVAAVAVFGVVASGTAYAVTLPGRTHLPGLRTPGDGRAVYPPLALPGLPAGAPEPGDPANRTGRHYAGVGGLLLPPPRGATADPAFRHATQRRVTGRFLSELGAEDLERDRLAESGYRHIAGRAWTTPDHTRTAVYLVQFPTEVLAREYEDQVSSESMLEVSPQATPTGDITFPGVPHGVGHDSFKDDADPRARYTWLVSGDVAALVVTSRKDKHEDVTVPHEQAVILQAELLR
jgi:hypothetical protein